MKSPFLTPVVALALCLSPCFAQDAAPATEPAPAPPAESAAPAAPAVDPQAELAALNTKLTEANKAAESDPAVQAAKVELDNAKKAFAPIRDEVLTRLDPEGKIKALQDRIKAAADEEKKALGQELKTLMASIEADPAFQAGNKALKDAETAYKKLRDEARAKALPDYSALNSQANKLKKELSTKPVQ